ncbi:hypothetical protein ACFVGN_33400, partial [Streptomyces sp. NPDC057757]
MPRRTRRVLVTPALAAAATLLIAGCSDSSTDGQDEGQPPSATNAGSSPAPSAEPATLEELAKAVGCTKPKEAGK